MRTADPLLLFTRPFLRVVASASVVLCTAGASYTQLLTPPALDSVRTFRSIESAMKNPEQVYRLDLSGQKLRTIPEEVKQLRNLNALTLNRNKLKELPDWLGELSNMQELGLHRNKLVHFPEVICQLTHL